MPSASATSISRERLLQIARGLPADLEVLSELGEMLQDVNAELDAVARLLRRDLALSVRIVRISNSPVFGGGARIGTIEEAVNRVGFGEVMKLVGTASVTRFSERTLATYGISAELLRDNMLYGALAAEALAHAAGRDHRLAYTAGLLRPLGLMVLDRASRGSERPVPAYARGTWDSYAAWEGSVFGIDNGEVAALILESWSFPPELCRAIRAHTLAFPADLEQPLAALLNVAETLTHQAGHSLPGEFRWWGLTERTLAAAGLDENHIEAALLDLAPAFAEMRTAVMT